MPTQPLNVFISYSHNELDRPLLDELLKHLAPLQQVENRIIKTWDDAHILPGEAWDDEIKNSLRQADIVLLLISADFNNSRYIQEIELKESIRKHKDGACHVVPILLRPCDFGGMPYESFEMLPKLPENQKLKAITAWQNTDTAFTEVVRWFRELIQKILDQKKLNPVIVAPREMDWDDPWHAFFNANRFVRSIKLPDTVNCDRFDHYPKMEQHFELNKKKEGNLAYFITACNFQKPESLVKRLAYWYDDEIAVFFRPELEKNKDEINIIPLPLEKKEEITWDRVWSLVKKNIIQQDIDFEDFIGAPILPVPDMTRILLPFHISESDLLEYKANKHIRHIIHQFARLPAPSQRFVLCFVFHLPEVHDARKEKCAPLLQLLEEMSNPADPELKKAHGMHVSCLPAVYYEDLKVWWNARFDPLRFTDLTRELKIRVLPEKKDACNQHGLYDMHTIEEMQYAAYTFIRDNKPA